MAVATGAAVVAPTPAAVAKAPVAEDAVDYLAAFALALPLAVAVAVVVVTTAVVTMVVVATAAVAVVVAATVAPAIVVPEAVAPPVVVAPTAITIAARATKMWLRLSKCPRRKPRYL
jgi:hypothetical protein